MIRFFAIVVGHPICSPAHKCSAHFTNEMHIRLEILATIAHHRMDPQLHTIDQAQLPLHGIGYQARYFSTIQHLNFPFQSIAFQGTRAALIATCAE